MLGAHLKGAVLLAHPALSIVVVSEGKSEKFLGDIVFDEATILPDGTKWTPRTDMRRFTDPNHPKFWPMVQEET